MAGLVSVDPTFWTGRRVLVTGHTGFKGAWLSFWLSRLGAQVWGLALPPETEPDLFGQLDLAGRMDHAILDVRDRGAVADRVAAAAPEIVFHLAAQPLVRRSYREPVETWATNVQGTAHLLDALGLIDAPMAIVLVTTDKVYRNREWLHAYREPDTLGGHDPYAASKAATELLADSWRASFFAGGPQRLATARAGNVIGGGDWSEDRILPDIIRALSAGRPVEVRNPGATRPWQHVLDPLAGYMQLAERLFTSDDAAWQTAFNFGPDSGGQRSVREVVETALASWPGSWNQVSQSAAPHEAGLLALATYKARTQLGWRPVWDFETAVTRTVEWYRAAADGTDIAALTETQIRDFGGLA